MSRESAFQTYLDNVQAMSGKSPQELVVEAKERGLTRSSEIIAWLKLDYGLGVGHARAIDYVIQHGPTYTYRDGDGHDRSGSLVLDGSSLPRRTAGLG